MAQNSTNPKAQYIPGVCNIGPAERAKRRQAGVISGFAAVILLVTLSAIGAPKAWRLLLILPVMGAASGYLQDRLQFCAGFGMKGLYNVTNRVGATNAVGSEEFRLADKRKAQQILAMSFSAGVFAALVCMF